jgi:hypothetical protein
VLSGGPLVVVAEGLWVGPVPVPCGVDEGLSCPVVGIEDANDAEDAEDDADGTVDRG